MSVCIYSYGALKPITNFAKVDEQLLLAHRYRNKLVEIELQRRAAVQAAVERHFPDYVAAQAKADEAGKAVEEEWDKVRAANAAARQRTQTPEQKTALKEMQKEKSALYKAAKALKKSAFAKEGKVFVHAGFQDDMEKIETENNVIRKQARAACGLYHGTYIEVEDAATKMRSGMPPRFKRYTGEGKSSVQIQNGLAVEDLAEGKHMQLRIFNPKTQNNGQPENRQWVHIIYRVCSENRAPVWATVPVMFSRPLPAGSRIKRAWLLRRRIGPNYKYFFQFVIDMPPKPRPENAKGTVALDVGWRKVKNGIRVAVWKGNDGGSGELVIPDDIIERWKYPRTIQGYRDTNLAPVMLFFRHWLQGFIDRESLRLLVDFWQGRLDRSHPKARENTELAAAALSYFGGQSVNEFKLETPEWMKERTKTIHAWKSAAQLASLLMFWRENRFAGDEHIYTVLEMWRRQDKHLWQWESHQRAQVIRWRNYTYTKFAYDMAQRYERAVVEDVNWADLQRDKGPAEQKASDAALTAYRALAAPGKLVECLRLSLPTLQVAAQHKTKTCYGCGNVEEFDAARAIHHACSKCGHVWDQDENAADNILRAAEQEETLKPAKFLATVFAEKTD